MATAALIIALVGSSITVAQNTFTLEEAIRATAKGTKTAAVVTEHHTVRPLMRHVLRPMARRMAGRK